MDKDSRIFVAGASGLVGNALQYRLRACGYTDITTRSSRELDLTHQQDVEEYFKGQCFDCVFLAAAYVGGIFSNSNNQSEFLKRNALMELNVMDAAQRAGVNDLVFIGSACVYPPLSSMAESDFLTGEPDPTHRGYAMAKILGVEYCRMLHDEKGLNYFSVFPCNLYGPYDNFNLKTCHVAPSLIRRIDEAARRNDRAFEIRGAGGTIREFLYADDLADACIFLLENERTLPYYNVGSQVSTSIRELAQTVASVVGYEGAIDFELSDEDSLPSRIIDSRAIRKLGWKSHTSLNEGIAATYDFYKMAKENGSLRS